MDPIRFLSLFFRSLLYWSTGRFSEGKESEAHVKTEDGMNRVQRHILFTAAIIVAAMLLYPPFHIVVRGVAFDAKYAWLWSPPSTKHSVNIWLLLAQWIGTLIISILLAVASKTR